MEKLVVKDRGYQPESVFDIVDRILGANQPSLAKYAAVFLPGDFFGHLEDQFHQCVWAVAAGRETARPTG